MTLTLHATPEEVMRAVETLQEFTASSGVPEKAIFGLALALEECGSNIVNHALAREPEKTFQVSLESNPNSFVIELRDPGPHFDPTVSQITSRGENDEPGGWGIELVRRYIDEIRYTREGSENVLRLTKRLSSASIGKSLYPTHANP
jgi:anti-sigma regulatory factor (Ser/Thr protein kinase)